MLQISMEILQRLFRQPMVCVSCVKQIFKISSMKLYATNKIQNSMLQETQNCFMRSMSLTLKILLSMFWTTIPMIQHWSKLFLKVISFFSSSLNNLMRRKRIWILHDLNFWNYYCKTCYSRLPHNFPKNRNPEKTKNLNKTRNLIFF